MKTRLERRLFKITDRVRIDGIRVRGPRPSGILFAPPLIGGGGAQQLRVLRRLVRKNLDLVTFCFSGHGRSTDKFSLETTLRDTKFLLDRTARQSERERLPLYGIASSYSAIPLLHSASSLGEPFLGMVLINPLPGWSPFPIFDSLFAHLKKYRHENRDGRRQGSAFRGYADFLFPGIGKTADHFGMLKRRRTRLLRVIREFLFLDPLERVRLPETPVLCLYSRDDHILKIFQPEMADAYENQIRRTCPRACFKRLDGDHFLSTPRIRRDACRSILPFLGSAACGHLLLS